MKNENGVTIMALIITIIILTIIGMTVFYTAKGIDENVEDDVLIAELETVHQIVLQEYNKKLILGDKYTLKGTVLNTTADLEKHKTSLGIKEFKTTYDKYYELTPTELNSIDGVKNASSSYLVCYETGEVANITKYKTSDGEALYTN